MSDYIINFTDPGNGSFVIKPMTTNGPASPASAVPLDPQATAANTSLVLLGKGMWMYGERVAEDLVHMLEHFAYSSAPAYPIQGQIWFDNTLGSESLNVYDGATWIPILSGLPPAGDFDMNGFRIINLGDPTGPTDALNLGFADNRYVNITGDTMTGFLTLSGTPINPLHATTKQYVDTEIATAGAAFVLKAGDTMTGTLFLNGGDLEIQGTGGFTFNSTGTIDMGGQRVQNVADPVFPQDAATKQYADTLFAGAGADGVVYNGIYNLGTHTLTLQRTLALPDVNIPGIAGVGDVWQTNSIRHPLDPAYNSSYLREQFVSDSQYPNDVPFDQIVNSIDQQLFATTAIPKRMMIQADGGSTYSLIFDYTTYTNKLSIYSNGIKQYADQRGHFIIDLESPTVNIGTDTGLTASMYDFDIVVDNTLYNVTVDLTAEVLPINYYKLLTAIDVGLVGALVPATTYFRDSRLNFIADSQGRLSSVYIDITSGGTPLFTAIVGTTLAPSPLTSMVDVLTAATGPNRFTVSGDYSTSFPTGTLFVVFGSTSNDGTYVVAAPGASFAGTTTIPVTTAVTASGADGTIFYSRTLDYQENGTPLSPILQGTSFVFNTGEEPVAGDNIEIIILP